MTLGLFPKQADESLFPSLVSVFRGVPHVGDPFRSVAQDTGQSFSWDVGEAFLVPQHLTVHAPRDAGARTDVPVGIESQAQIPCAHAVPSSLSKTFFLPRPSEASNFAASRASRKWV